MSTFEPTKVDLDANAPQQVVPPYNPYGAPNPGYQQQTPYQAAAAATYPDANPPTDKGSGKDDDDDADSDAGARAPGTGIPLEYLDVR